MSRFARLSSVRGRDRVAILKARKRRILLNILMDAKVRYRCVVDVLLKCRV